jgi:hypothetical protein
MKAPRVAPLEGAFTYGFAIRVSNADERGFVVPGLYRRRTGSLPAGLCQWRRSEGRGLGFGFGGAVASLEIKELGCF